MDEINTLKRLIIRVNKTDAAFIYFQFEANDGLCFYSTLESSLGAPFRDIEIKTHNSLANELIRLIDHLKNVLHLEILNEEWVEDHPSCP